MKPRLALILADAREHLPIYGSLDEFVPEHLASMLSSHDHQFLQHHGLYANRVMVRRHKDEQGIYIGLPHVLEGNGLGEPVRGYPRLVDNGMPKEHLLEEGLHDLGQLVKLNEEPGIIVVTDLAHELIVKNVYQSLGYDVPAHSMVLHLVNTYK